MVSSGARAQACVQREGWERRVGSERCLRQRCGSERRQSRAPTWDWIRSCREFLRFRSRNVGAAHPVSQELRASKDSAPLLRYRTERVECLLDRACKAEKVDRASRAVASGVCKLHLRHGVTAGSSSMRLETAAADHCTQQVAAPPPKVRLPRGEGARLARRRAAEQSAALVAGCTSDNVPCQGPLDSARSALAELTTAAQQHGSVKRRTWGPNVGCLGW